MPVSARMLALGAFCLVALGALLSELGARHALLSGRPGAHAGWPAALSSELRKAALMDCANALRPARIALLPAADRRSAVRNCRNEARIAHAWLPASGLAWLVMALADAEAGDRAGFAAALARSAALAPHEGWLAMRRFDLARAAGCHLGGECRKTMARDGQVLLSYQAGAEYMALQYAASPALRPMLASLAQARPKAERQRLLNLLTRRAAAPRGGRS